MVAKLKIGAVYRCSGFYNSSSIQVPSYKYGLGSSGDCHVIFVMTKSDISHKVQNVRGHHSFTFFTFCFRLLM